MENTRKTQELTTLALEKRQDASLDARQTRQMHRAPSRRRANGLGGFKADSAGGAEALAYVQQRYSLMIGLPLLLYAMSRELHALHMDLQPQCSLFACNDFWKATEIGAWTFESRDLRRLIKEPTDDLSDDVWRMLRDTCPQVGVRWEEAALFASLTVTVQMQSRDLLWTLVSTVRTHYPLTSHLAPTLRFP